MSICGSPGRKVLIASRAEVSFAVASQHVSGAASFFRPPHETVDGAIYGLASSRVANLI